MQESLWHSVKHEAAAWLPLNDRDRQAQVDANLAVVTYAEASMQKNRATTHFTASVFLFDRALERVALCYHRKGQFWVQPGGHLEANDESVAAAALRELSEETGVDADLAVIAGALDLDSHALGDGFGACARHLDFGVAARLLRAEVPKLKVSDESERLTWALVDELPPNCAPGLVDRIALMRKRLRSILSAV